MRLARRREAASSRSRSLCPSSCSPLVFHRQLIAWFSGESPASSTGANVTAHTAVGGGAPSEAGTPGEVDHYTCSMHPSVKEAAPGKCPICGMDLIPVTKEQQQEGVVMIDDARRQLIGVRTEPVVLAPMRKDFRVVGHVAYDESSLADVNLKVHGWITKLYVSQTGQKVTRGQTLLSLYSPELYNAEQDFILASQGAATPSLSPGGGPGRVETLARAATSAAALARPGGHADRRADQARSAVGERPDRGARERLHHREERRGGRVGRRRHAPLSHRGADQGVDRGPGLRGRPRERPRGSGGVP